MIRRWQIQTRNVVEMFLIAAYKIDEMNGNDTLRAYVQQNLNPRQRRQLAKLYLIKSKDAGITWPFPWNKPQSKRMSLKELFKKMWLALIECCVSLVCDPYSDTVTNSCHLERRAKRTETCHKTSQRVKWAEGHIIFSIIHNWSHY